MICGYLIVQAAAVSVWWVVLLTVPETIRWFNPAGWPDDALLSFGLADGLLLVGGSVVTAAAVAAKKPWAGTAIWSLSAAVAYPTLYCIGVALTAGEGWVAAGAMSSASGLTLAMATIHGRGDQPPGFFRAARMKPAAAVVWTLIQTVIFWSTFLWILPWAIVEFEQRLGLPTGFAHPGQTIGAGFVFAGASVLGLWSGYTMAVKGRGTPLPTATASRLVIAGPYRFVRNPMALAGITQGLAVGWYLGSWGVVLYAACGGVLWHIFVRPVEENDMTQRFGEAYTHYRKHVRLWLPSLTSSAEYPRQDSNLRPSA